MAFNDPECRFEELDVVSRCRISASPPNGATMSDQARYRPGAELRELVVAGQRPADGRAEDLSDPGADGDRIEGDLGIGDLAAGVLGDVEFAVRLAAVGAIDFEKIVTRCENLRLRLEYAANVKCDDGQGRRSGHR